MDEHPNAAVLRRLIDAFDARDQQAMADTLADEVEWHEIGRAEPRGRRLGHQRLDP